jgi:hypothetical protein
MGVVPVKLPTSPPTASAMAIGSDPRLPRGRSTSTCAARATRMGGCDGWHFVQCPDCGGSGEIAWWRALRYLPGKAWRTLFFVWDHGVRSYSRPPWMTWREQMVMVLRIAVGKPARR